MSFLALTGPIKVSKLTKRHVRLFIKPDLVGFDHPFGNQNVLACLNLAMKDGLISVNPVKDVEKPAWERRELVLTGDELAKLPSAARSRLKRSRGHGRFRVQAGRNLLADSRGLFSRRLGVAGGEQNQEQDRRQEAADLPDAGARGADAEADRRSYQGAFVPEPYGKPWQTDTIRCRFRNLREKLGLSKGVVPYGTRHRFASDAINRQKMDSLVVARLMGHSDARMLQKTYFREDTEAMVEAMKKATGK